MFGTRKIAVCFGVLMLVSAACGQMAPANPGVAAGQYSGTAATTNQLVLGVGASAIYDSNAFNTPQAQGQAEFGATPRVSWDISHSHWSSMLNYSANIMRSVRFSYYDLTSHSLSTQFNYQLNRSLSFTASDSFVHTADPLYASPQLYQNVANPGAPNPSFLGTASILTSNFVTADAFYRLDARSDVSVGGSYSIQRYSNSIGPSLQDSNGATGTASYHHAFSARMKSGVSYDISKFTTTAGFDTISQRILANQEITFTPTMSVSLFAGPNHVSNTFPAILSGSTASLTGGGWSWSAGGTYTWSTARLSMSGSAVRQVSTGGGLVGTVRLTSFQYGLSGKLPHKFSGSMYVGYTLNDRLYTTAALSQNPKYASAGATITRNLRRDLTASIAYDRMEQLLGFGPVNPWIDRDRVTISLNYSFTHPLGR